jgi:glycosyltransferase 2 family protein
VKRLLGYLFAAACLVWVFHDIDFHEFAAHAKSIAWWAVAVGIACDILSYVCQGFRWKMLLRPTGELPVIRTTQAIYAGLFTNEMVPLRAGEIVRMFLVARWLGVEFIAILPSYLVGRMFDAIWLGIAVGLAALFVPLPHRLIVGEEALGVIILVLTAVFVLAVAKKKKSIGASPSAKQGKPPGASAAVEQGQSIGSSAAARAVRRPRFLPRLVAETAGGLAKIGVTRGFFLAALGSAGILVFQMLAFWLIMVAMDLPLSIWQGAVALLIVHMGTAIPNAPSNVGSYQFFTVVALAIFGVDKTAAASFSVVAFVLLTIPLWLIGFAAIRKTGMSFAELRAEAAKLVGVVRS